MTSEHYLGIHWNYPRTIKYFLRERSLFMAGGGGGGSRGGGGRKFLRPIVTGGGGNFFLAYLFGGAIFF